MSHPLSHQIGNLFLYMNGLKLRKLEYFMSDRENASKVVPRYYTWKEVSKDRITDIRAIDFEHLYKLLCFKWLDDGQMYDVLILDLGSENIIVLDRVQLIATTSLLRVSDRARNFYVSFADLGSQKIDYTRKSWIPLEAFIDEGRLVIYNDGVKKLGRVAKRNRYDFTLDDDIAVERTEIVYVLKKGDVLTYEVVPDEPKSGGGLSDALKNVFRSRKTNPYTGSYPTMLDRPSKMFLTSVDSDSQRIAGETSASSTSPTVPPNPVSTHGYRSTEASSSPESESLREGEREDEGSPLPEDNIVQEEDDGGSSTKSRRTSLPSGSVTALSNSDQEARVQNLESEVKRYNSDLEKANVAIVELGEDLNNRDKDLASAENRYREAKLGIFEKEKQIANFEKELTAAKRRNEKTYEETEADTAFLSNTLEALEAAAQTGDVLQDKIKQLEKDIREKAEELEKNREDMENAKKAKEVAETARKEDIEKLRAQIEAHEKAQKEADGLRTKLQEQEKALREDIEGKAALIDLVNVELRKAWEDSEKRNTQMENMVGAVEVERKEVEKRIIELRSVLNENERVLEAVRDREDNQKAEIERLKQEAERQRGDMTNMQDRLTKADKDRETDVHALTGKIEALEEELVETNRQAGESEAEVGRLKQEADTLQKAKTVLQDNLKRAEEEKEIAAQENAGKIEALEREKVGANGEIQRLQEVERATTETSERLKAELERTQAATNTANEKFLALIKKFGDSESNLRNIQKKVAALSAELDKTKAEFRGVVVNRDTAGLQLEETIRTLQTQLDDKNWEIENLKQEKEAIAIDLVAAASTAAAAAANASSTRRGVSTSTLSDTKSSVRENADKMAAATAAKAHYTPSSGKLVGEIKEILSGGEIELTNGKERKKLCWRRIKLEQVKGKNIRLLSTKVNKVDVVHEDNNIIL